ncbi:FISUMP domain-containing protein [Riemerella anatipestifer]|uniref:Uncharacterized protein n=1 Tax=Riemerella anatipestifer RA-CH-1 TaxID=1228997 RepID=J9QY54_RIEAN|nr:FISUMP domain-containing protein [Riemerella anatipestifer]AFR35335.1 hypothetical protein B739_0733 [Riemerella anatipestifer RA-CH-1]AIH02360.1 hypothetical protein M949_1191 [Riemerella anatipestifer CH3]MCO7332288.1 hypothetical protein [Riemerella anatipestifer]MCO7351177.1 hypothetical protein [Riemerella anatipestifer]MCU7582970.1 hypothetical protein [Riemerella anatipestifer]
MKKTLLCAAFLPLVLNAQDYNGRVGINTKEPQATLDISKKELNTLPSGHTQGVLFPEFTTSERSTFTNPKKGTMIYNTNKECIEIYRGVSGGVHQWSCLPDVGSSKAQSIAVTPQGFEGAYIGGVTFNNSQKVKFKLENNSLSNVNSSFADAVSIQNGFSDVSIIDCNWTLLPSGTGGGNCFESNTVSLASGQAALLTYTMGGKPERGTLTANFTKLGAQADQQTQVGLGTATITSPKTEYVISLTSDGTTIQGKINNTTDKLIVKIPYTNGSGSYNAVTSQAITTALGEGNDTNSLTLTIPAGNFGVSGDLEATITVSGDDQEHLVKMLPPGQEYDIATIPYTLNGKSYQLVLKGIGGVRDRCFNKTTFDCVGYGSTTEKEHQFIYIPIKGPDGRTWLNNNLGAEYAHVDSPWFNPTRQAGALDYTNTSTAVPLSNPTADQIKRDWRAYGSLFQWQRNPDGHELITWTNATSGTPKYTTVATTLSDSWTNPGHSNFIKGNSSSSHSWVTSSLNETSIQKDLWQSSGTGKTNPCPSGYHVPTHAEQVALHNAITGQNLGNSLSSSSVMWNESVLRLSASGYLSTYETILATQSSGGYFWSSEQSYSYNSWLLWFNNNKNGAGNSDLRAYGFSVRCIKDN